MPNLLPSVISLEELIKNRIQAYLYAKTGVFWNNPAIHPENDSDPICWVNLYSQRRTGPSTANGNVFNPHRVRSTEYSLELRLKFRGNNIDSVDNNVLRWYGFLGDILEDLAKNGEREELLIESAGYLKGFRVDEMKKTWEQISTGNQDDNSDSVYEFVLQIFATKKRE